MHEEQVAAFRAAVEDGDADAVLATFADQITFNNPVTFRPFEGKETTAFVVPRCWRSGRTCATWPSSAETTSSVSSLTRVSEIVKSGASTCLLR
jgi:hypothetical protein